MSPRFDSICTNCTDPAWPADNDRLASPARVDGRQSKSVWPPPCNRPLNRPFRRTGPSKGEEMSANETTFKRAARLFTGVAVLAAAAPSKAQPSQKPTIVLVHGAFNESSSWEGVIRLLQADG